MATMAIVVKPTFVGRKVWQKGGNRQIKSMANGNRRKSNDKNNSRKTNVYV